MRQLVFFAAISLAACGGSTTVTLCNGTAMGKLMGTFSVCNELDQRYRANLDNWELTAAYNELPTSFTWTTAWTVKGAPDAKKLPRQYNQDQADTECNVTMKKGALTWVARHGAGVPASGTCQLTLSDVTQIEVMGNVTTYKIKGNISALLEAEPGSGATDTVTVTLDLCQGDSTLCVPPTMM